MVRNDSLRIGKIRDFILVFFFFSHFLLEASAFPWQAKEKDIGVNKVEHLNWQGTEVIWLEDERFPTYDLFLYFADGALSDPAGKEGTTELMFNHLASGTTRYNQNEISDALEFYGVDFGAQVTHEYSLFQISGLTKDILPTVKMICHLFDKSVFPREEIEKDKRRIKDSLENLISEPQELADRALRALSLKNTPYVHPSGGTLKSLKKIESKDLAEKLKYFKEGVKKKIYIVGNEKTQIVKQVLLNECGFKTETARYERKREDGSKFITKRKQKIYLIPVANSNQAQIRLGVPLQDDEIQDHELMNVASHLLGGGFTSILMQELRAKRGLTYGVQVMAQRQKEYGRAILSTSTKNESVKEAIQVIQDSLNQAAKGEFGPGVLEKSIHHLGGHYLFGLESSSAYLQQLIFADHINLPYERLHRFPEIISQFKDQEVAKEIGKIFDWNKATIVVVGSKKLESQLKSFGEVHVLPYRDFL